MIYFVSFLCITLLIVLWDHFKLAREYKEYRDFVDRSNAEIDEMIAGLEETYNAASPAFFIDLRKLRKYTT